MVQASDVTPTDMTTDGDPASRSPTMPGPARFTVVVIIRLRRTPDVVRQSRLVVLPTHQRHDIRTRMPRRHPC